MIIGESIIKDVVRPLIWFGLRWVVRIVPPGWEFSFYKGMGKVFYCLCPRKRKQLLFHLAVLLGNERKLGPIARRCVENHFVNRYLNFSFPKITRENLHRYVSVEGLELLDAALAQGNGCVLVHAHFGPSQLLLFALGRLGYRVNQVGGPDVEGLSRLGRYCLRMFRRDEKMIPARIIQSEEFLRPVFECLRENEILMTAGDGTGGSRFIGKNLPFPFMGRRLLFPVGAASIAIRTGAQYLPIFMMPGEKEARYHVVICPEIRAAAGGDVDDAAVDMTKKFLLVFSRWLERYPYLWHFWDELECRMVGAEQAGE